MGRDPWKCRCTPIRYVGLCPDGVYVLRVIHTKKSCKAVEELSTNYEGEPTCSLSDCEIPFVNDFGLCPIHGSHAPRRIA